MKTVHGLAIFAVLFAWSTVWGVGAAEEAGPKSTAEGNTAFALDLYGRLRGAEGNLFFSPLSIRTALGMTYAGARNETARQMAKVLYLPEEQVRAHGELGELVHLLNQLNKTKACKLTIANALWGQKDYKFRGEFLTVVERNYDAGFGLVDFIRRREAARKTINDWVAKKTNDKIKDLVPPAALDAMTRLVLTNAIYFKADWEEPFKKWATRDRPFFVTKDTQKNVPTMYQTDTFGYAETDEVQVCELPYKGRKLSMVILLPRKRDGLAELEKAFTPGKLQGWLGKIRRQRVRLYLPKFRTEAQFSLGSALAAMGMSDAFVFGRADFSGMDGTKLLYISSVIHKAFVAVDEKGTEAAAATAVMVAAGSAPMRRKEPPTFRADHPFVFLIREGKTGSILFLGRLVDPKED